MFRIHDSDGVPACSSAIVDYRKIRWLGRPRGVSPQPVLMVEGRGGGVNGEVSWGEAMSDRGWALGLPHAARAQQRSRQHAGGSLFSATETGFPNTLLKVDHVTHPCEHKTKASAPHNSGTARSERGHMPTAVAPASVLAENHMFLLAIGHRRIDAYRQG